MTIFINEISKNLFYKTPYYIPNAFTPNSDGNNEVFRIYGLYKYKTYSMRIYNRWGEIIFVSNDPEIGWDGSYGDSRKMAPIGAYTYKLNYKLKNQEQPNVISGHVNLIR